MQTLLRHHLRYGSAGLLVVEYWSPGSEWHPSGVLLDTWDGSGTLSVLQVRNTLTNKSRESCGGACTGHLGLVCSYFLKEFTQLIWFVAHNSDADASPVLHFRNTKCFHHQCPVTGFCVTHDQQLVIKAKYFYFQA